MSAQRVLITGTTSGVGRALLAHYVDLGAAVVSVNRRRDPELEARFPEVRFECVDVRDAQAVEDLVQRLATAGGLPSVFLLNAGINAVDNDEAFDLDTYKRVVETNLYGVLHFVAPLTRIPRAGSENGRAHERREIHVVALCSMAGFVGNPYALGYFTSKKALISCFDVWAAMYEGTDLIFQQVILGPVPTSIFTIADRLPAGRLSRLMVRVRDLFSGSLSGAVQAIGAFAVTRRRRLYYPARAVPLFTGMKVAQNLIPGFYQGRRTLSGSARR